MIVFCVLISPILTFIYLHSNWSPWAPAIAHATLNSFAYVPLLLLKMEELDFAISGTLCSMVGWIPIIATLACLAWWPSARVIMETASPPPPSDSTLPPTRAPDESTALLVQNQQSPTEPQLQKQTAK